MKIKKFLCLILMLVTAIPALAQKTLTGTVKDETQQPVIGASIMVKGADNKGTVTDIDGKFSLVNISEDATLSISCIGFATEEISVAGKSSIDIILKEDINLIN